MIQHKIVDVEKNSIAYELGIMPGDFLISINETEIVDVFDYRYLIQSKHIRLCILHMKNENEITYEINKNEFDDLGLVFETGLMSKQCACKNKCIFCFIDQLPPNLRDTLYFKDDDIRLSFLYGNYVTLTNTTDLDRIIFYHLSPINISIHTTDNALRKLMMKNATDVMPMIKRLDSANIKLNFQIVLCNGINDGEMLDKTISDLLFANTQSISIVPAGLSKFRDGLFKLTPYDKNSSRQIINQVAAWQNKLHSKYGSKLVFLADEFYLTAQHSLPDYDDYEDFPQLENGVGMLALFKHECLDALDSINTCVNRKISIVTGVAAYHFINELCMRVMDKLPVQLNVIYVTNNFFGESITVSGLLTGIDVYNALKTNDVGDCVLLPANMFRDGVTLDDMPIEKLNEICKIEVVDTNGYEFLKSIT